MIIMQMNCEIEEHGCRVFLLSELSALSLRTEVVYRPGWGKLLEEKTLNLPVHDATELVWNFCWDYIENVNVKIISCKCFPIFKNFSSFAFSFRYET